MWICRLCRLYQCRFRATYWINTVYPKKYAHGFCFAVLWCGHTLTDYPISIRLTSLALWQSNDCPSASKATLMNMDKYFMWIHYERLHNHNKAKHNKTVCIFLGIYCTHYGLETPYGGSQHQLIRIMGRRLFDPLQLPEPMLIFANGTFGNEFQGNLNLNNYWDHTQMAWVLCVLLSSQSWVHLVKR